MSLWKAIRSQALLITIVVGVTAIGAMVLAAYR
jgi:hypothetical protein